MIWISLSEGNSVLEASWGPRASARPQTESTKARSDLLSIVHVLIQYIIIPFCVFSDQKYTKYIAIIKYMY